MAAGKCILHRTETEAHALARVSRLACPLLSEASRSRRSSSISGLIASRASRLSFAALNRLAVCVISVVKFFSAAKKESKPNIELSHCRE